MTNPCCERCAERLGGSGGGFLPNCANFACECHKSAGKCNCDGLETEGKHYKSCPAFAPSDTAGKKCIKGHCKYRDNHKGIAITCGCECHFAPTDTSEEWKAGHAAALSKVKEMIAELEKAVGYNESYSNALSDLLDHLKTIE